MAGANFDPFPVPLAMQPVVFVAAKYDRQAGKSTVMPNVRVESYQIVEGATPHTAQFSYVLDNSVPSGQNPFPADFKDLWGAGAVGPYVVKDDDEILVYMMTPSGDSVLVFDGFAEVAQVNAEQGQAVSFVAVSVHKRLWDSVIEGSHWRDADKPQSHSTDDVVKINAPAWFNPKAKANKTPDDHDVNQDQAGHYPVFLDEDMPGDPKPQARWKLSDLLTYLCRVYNADEKWVKNPVAPIPGGLADFLKAIKPTDGQIFRLKDSTSYTKEPIYVRSLDASNRPWVEVVAEQLHYYGFEMFFYTRDDDDGKPENGIVIYRKDGLDGASPKEVFWPLGGSLADGLPDINAVELAKDGNKPANEFRIETGEELLEASFILVPLFEIDPADAADSAAIDKFDRAKVMDQPIAVRSKYRWYGVDECGIGHWDYDADAFVTGKPFNFDDLLGESEVPEDGGDRLRKWVHRLRPGLNTVISQDDGGNARTAKLEISRDYVGPVPTIWDPEDKTSTWRSLADGGWRLLKDRLGIEINADNPESWRLPRNDGSQAPGDVVRGITSQANPGSDDNSKPFYLRLTTVIPSDKGMDAVASKRDASPSPWTIRRSIDSKDHFKKRTIHKSSDYNKGDVSTSPDDDTDKAKDAAEALRTTHEMPPLAGSVKVPWVTLSVGVGDLISKISGREVLMYDNKAIDSGESPRYPAVIGVSYSCQNPQSTAFKLSDRRSEPQKV